LKVHRKLFIDKIKLAVVPVSLLVSLLELGLGLGLGRGWD